MKWMEMISALTSLLLVGCASLALHKQATAWAEVSKFALECRELHLKGVLKTPVDSAQCSRDKMRRVLQWRGYPYVGLVELILASRMALSERMDVRAHRVLPTLAVEKFAPPAFYVVVPTGSTGRL